jgi:hypothetical protein
MGGSSSRAMTIVAAPLPCIGPGMLLLSGRRRRTAHSGERATGFPLGRRDQRVSRIDSPIVRLRRTVGLSSTKDLLLGRRWLRETRAPACKKGEHHGVFRFNRYADPDQATKQVWELSAHGPRRARATPGASRRARGDEQATYREPAPVRRRAFARWTLRRRWRCGSKSCGSCSLPIAIRAERA